jgi:hypothetical protein
MHLLILSYIGALLSLIMTDASAQSLDEVTSRECVYGDCIDGPGRLELKTSVGRGFYSGNFRAGIFHGQGRLEIPISSVEKEIYVGDWDQGIRKGRGTHWNGNGQLYIGQWANNKREGQGSYFINMPRWAENQNSEFWLRENTENYTGDFVNDFYHGQGTYRWPDGQKFVGGFFANKKHGKGIFYYATGTIRQQNWEYGKLID